MIKENIVTAEFAVSTIGAIKSNLPFYRGLVQNQIDKLEMPMAKMALDYLEQMITVVEFQNEYIADTSLNETQYLLECLNKAHEHTQQLMLIGTKSGLTINSTTDIKG